MADTYYHESSADAVYLTRVDDSYSYESVDSAYKPFDSAQYGPTETVPGHVAEFEDEIDNLAFIDPSFNTDVHNLPLAVDSGDIFSLLRSETPTRGVLSTFTVSSNSESAYGSGYNDAASAYTYNSPSQYSASNYLASPSSQYMGNPVLAEIDLAMEGLGLRPVDVGSAYGSALSTPNLELSPALSTFPQPTPFNTRSALSEYDPVPAQVHVASSSASDYYPGRASPVRQTTVSPASVSAPLATTVQGPTPVASPQTNTTPLKLEGGNPAEPERRFPCPSCPRSFTRRYNLKTHIATHDANRLKPFICDKKSCGRSFSRKNDLKRHMRSIHRPDTPTSSVRSVGVGANPRTRCEKCGRSWVGMEKDSGCECDDVK